MKEKQSMDWDFGPRKNIMPCYFLIYNRLLFRSFGSYSKGPDILSMLAGVPYFPRLEQI